MVMYFLSVSALVIVLYFVSFYLVFSFNEWFLVWLGMELNMISFLVLCYSINNVMVIESMAKYFFIQSLGSGGFTGMVYLGWSDVVWGILLGMKMGLGPFYFWYISVVRNFSWVMNYFLMIFQKVIMFYLMSEVMSFVIWVLGVLSLLIGMVGSFNQMNLKVLLAYSSVHHSGWIMCLLVVGDVLWGVYLGFYGILMTGVIDVFSKMNMFMVMYCSSKKMSISLITSILNLGGVPPLMGFMLKVYSFYNVMKLDYLLLVFMALFSVGMMYVYFRLVYGVILNEGLVVGWGLWFKWGFSLWEVFSFFGLIVFVLLFYVGV